MKNVPVIKIDNHVGEIGNHVGETGNGVGETGNSVGKTGDSVGEISNGVGGIGGLHCEGIECICCLTEMIGNDLKLLRRSLERIHCHNLYVEG